MSMQIQHTGPQVGTTSRLAVSSNGELLRASSAGVAIGDDALKDRHVAGWLYDLPSIERAPWIERFHWIRAVDRMAESEAIDSRYRAFSDFLDGWQRLYETAAVDASRPHADLLRSIKTRWFGFERHRSQHAVHAFDRYVRATDSYRDLDLELTTLADFDHMLRDLSGSILLSSVRSS